MRLMKTFDGFFRVVAKIAQKFAACLMLLMICVVSIQVLGRIFAFKLPWTEEVATYSLIWMTYIGSIAVLIKGEHLTVDLFLVRYKPRQRRAARVLIDLVIVAFCGILLVFGSSLCRNPIVINGTTPALGISRLWIYLSLPISMLFTELYSVYDLVCSIADLASGGTLRGEKEVSE
jgi:TRAP-type C4-dicarboxylate transport system permease small subunit